MAMIFNNPPLFSWLAAASVALAILSIVYRSVFRGWTFFNLNRWILLGGTCACLLLPLVSSQVMHGLFASESTTPTFRLNMTSLPAFKSNVSPGIENGVNAPASYEWLWVMLSVVYWTGVAAMLARSFKAIMQLRTIKSQAELLSSDSVANAWVQSQLPSFSFGKNIYLNVHTLSLASPQLASILRHEEGHVLQRHSIDNVFFEIVSGIFWFNPFVRRLALDLKDVHEFLADRWATAPMRHKTEYQELLVTLASKTPFNRVTHPFSDSQFFRRIVMLNKPKTNAMESLKLLVLAPACIAAIFISACVDSEKAAPANTHSESSKTSSGPVISKITWTGNKLHSDGELNELLGIKPGDKYDARLFQEALFKGDKSVTSLYMDNGYLFFYTDITEKLVDGKMELTIHISEDEQVWVNEVTVKGKSGGQTLTNNVRSLLDVKKGQLFNRSLLITSQEKVAKSGLVNPDSVAVNPYPLSKASAGGRKYVDIEFVVENP